MTKRKKILIASVCFLTVCAVIGGAYLHHYLSIDRREYALIVEGELSPVLEVFDDYEEKGAYVSVDGLRDDSIVVNIKSSLKTDGLGVYELLYWVEGREQLSKTRTVTIVDTQSPEIKLKGGTVNLLVGEEYKEPGYDVSDNYDTEIEDKVVVEGEVNTKNAGTYTLTYSVSDQSDNSHSVKREVIVTKPKPVVHVKPVEEKGEEVKVVVPKTGEVLKEITALKFSGDGFKLEGSHETLIQAVNLVNKDTQNTVTYDTQLSDHKYSVNINVTNLENGSYSVRGREIDNAPLTFNLDPLLKLGRGRVGNKLVTFTYPNNTLEIKVEDFAYQYDIALNVGHGGHDSGAINKYIYEKVMNLEVSLYEKQRYEEHGLKVYINRTSDTFGEVIGESEWKSLTRSAFSFGHYAAVSRIAYSNHHNSSASSLDGWEIIVSAPSTREQNAVEHAIGAEFDTLIPNMAKRNRLYTRDYDSERNFSKMNGEVYNFTTYYAIIRIPLENYNARSVLFEPIYISDMEDFRWYYQEGNWKTVSEVKIKHYVESLGLNYIAPASTQTPSEESAELPQEEPQSDTSNSETPQPDDAE